MLTKDQPITGRSSRRDFLRGCAAAVAATALPAPLLASEKSPAAALLTRAIPSTGERLPLVGLGTNAYSVTDPAEIAKRQAVVARLVELGAKVIDTARAYGDSELVVGRILHELKMRDRVFLATKTPIQGELADPAQIVAETFRRLGTDTVDLLQIHNMHGTAELMPTLRKLKDDRRIRYIGATTSRDEQYPELLSALRSHPLDFIQVDYSIDNRNAAAELLSTAADKGVAVLVNMPFGGRREGNLLRKLGDRRAARRCDARAHGDLLGFAAGLKAAGGTLAERALTRRRVAHAALRPSTIRGPCTHPPPPGSSPSSPPHSPPAPALPRPRRAPPACW